MFGYASILHHKLGLCKVRLNFRVRQSVCFSFRFSKTRDLAFRKEQEQMADFLISAGNRQLTLLIAVPTFR